MNVIAGKLGDADGVSLRERVVFVDDRYQFMGKHMLIAKVRFALPCCGEHHIVLVVFQALDKWDAKTLEHVEFDFLAIVLGKIMEQRRQIVALHREHRAHIDRTTQLAVELLRKLDALVDLAKAPLDVYGKLFPERRETHTTPLTLEELHTQFGLKRFDRMRQRGWVI